MTTTRIMEMLLVVLTFVISISGQNHYNDQVGWYKSLNDKKIFDVYFCKSLFFPVSWSTVVTGPDLVHWLTAWLTERKMLSNVLTGEIWLLRNVKMFQMVQCFNSLINCLHSPGDNFPLQSCRTSPPSHHCFILLQTYRRHSRASSDDDQKENATLYHVFPHNQHLFQLPECASQQVRQSFNTKNPRWL